MAPQGAARIKKGLSFVCPTGMELGGALRNTEYTTRSFMCHIRPLWGLGFLRGALIQPQNQIL